MWRRVDRIKVFAGPDDAGLFAMINLLASFYVDDNAALRKVGENVIVVDEAKEVRNVLVLELFVRVTVISLCRFFACDRPRLDLNSTASAIARDPFTIG